MHFQQGTLWQFKAQNVLGVEVGHLGAEVEWTQAVLGWEPPPSSRSYSLLISVPHFYIKKKLFLIPSLFLRVAIVVESSDRWGI